MFDFEKNKKSIALISDSGEVVSYSELIDESSRFAEVIKNRCLAFILCENTIGSIVGYTSLLRNRVVPVLLNAHLERELLNELISLYCPTFIWMPDRMCDEFVDYTVVYGSFGYSLLNTNFKKQYRLYDELCMLLTTSGSTGSPKFVRQSYKNVLENAKSIVGYLELDSTEKPITTLPMNYTYGLSIINSHLLVGATILVTDKGLMQKEFWEFFRNQNATSFGGVPYTYEMLDRLRFSRMSLPSLKYSTQAGGKLTPELHKKFAENAKENGRKFIVMYGQCEATARMGYLPAEKAIEKCGSMGIAIPGGKFSLIDANGIEIKEPFVAGELVYEGANVTLGYAECGEDLVKGDERNGILYTGDVAQFDKDGFFYIVGRKKRFLKIYGNRVNLDEIDRMIKAKFSNLECASAGIDDHIYIFICDGFYKDQVKDYVVQMTKLNQAAFNIVIVDSIPKNDSGKILYKELAKYYES